MYYYTVHKTQNYAYFLYPPLQLLRMILYFSNFFFKYRPYIFLYRQQLEFSFFSNFPPPLFSNTYHLFWFFINFSRDFVNKSQGQTYDKVDLL